MRKILFPLVIVVLASCEPSKKGSAPENQHQLADDQQFDTLVGNYENKERDSWQKPLEVLSVFGDLSNKTVADIGAGSGYFSFLLTPLAKKVIAIEIDDRFIRFLEERRSTMPRELAEKLDIRLATMEDSHLDIGEADAILLVNTYIYLQNKVDYLTALKPCLKENGTILIVDFQKKPTRIGPAIELRLAPHQVVEDLRLAGFQEITVDNNTLPYQYLISATL